MFAEYAEYDATGLAALIAARQVSAAEVLQAALSRIDAREPRLNAMSQDCRARALAAPAPAPAGPFAGVPFLLKDLLQDYAGLPMTLGCVALKDYVPAQNAEIVNRYLRAGLVVLGSTATPELGLKATTETILHGATRNPWDTGRTPGGSSGGAAAAVAARYVPMAGASDGGGSIRIPASFNGLFGLKPSRGRVPEGPAQGEVWQGCVVSHVLTRSVRDSAAMLDALAGKLAGDPFEIAPPARPFLQEVGAPPGRLRIGFSVASPIGGRVDAGNREAVMQAAKLLESLGHHVEEAAPAIDGRLLARCYMTLYFGTVAAMLSRIRRETGKPERLFHADTRAIAMIGRAISAGTFVAMQEHWNGFARALAEFHTRFDLYLTPTVAMQPARIGELETPALMQIATKLLATLNAGKLLLKTGIIDKLSFDNLERTPFTQLGNMTFGPGMSVPLHWDAQGLPVGVLFNARFGAEDVLIRLASQLEAAAPWAGRRPAGV